MLFFIRLPRTIGISAYSASQKREFLSMIQIPPAVSVAVPMNTRTPSLDYLYIHAYRFSNKTYKIGIEGHLIDGVPVKIYSPEKTMVVCFKFRNKIGMGVPLEAVKLYKTIKNSTSANCSTNTQRVAWSQM